jgi:hypothetical protein
MIFWQFFIAPIAKVFNHFLFPRYASTVLPRSSHALRFLPTFAFLDADIFCVLSRTK